MNHESRLKSSHDANSSIHHLHLVHGLPDLHLLPVRLLLIFLVALRLLILPGVVGLLDAVLAIPSGNTIAIAYLISVCHPQGKASSIAL